MTLLRSALVLGAAISSSGLLTAAPAQAGGIGVIASPAFDNTCVTASHLVNAVGSTADTAGLATNLTQIPLDVPYQHCGGADDPLKIIEVEGTILHPVP
ncbi:hypothetical protein ACIRVF_27570 [Kitasatospora sp. NPDC101157]|uniref:hypothetical protein n=1 Tax=Kitasatospora sp. NPDC101157 TaxID=3364098 RepID=UPI003821560C